MRFSAQKFLTSHPADLSGLEQGLAKGEIKAEEIICIVGKTEGNGGRNDFTRDLAMLALEQLLGPLLKLSKHELHDRIVFSFSGGCEGVVTPHMVVFCKNGMKASQKQPRKSLTIAIGHTQEFRPEEIGRMPQIEETARVIKRVMSEAQIERESDVHLIQMKGAIPPFTMEQENTLLKSGKQMRADMAYSRGASALAAALALNEVRKEDINDDVVLNDFRFFSSVASCSAKPGLTRTEVIVFGNSAYTDGDLEIGHGVLRDIIDVQTVRHVAAGLGVDCHGGSVDGSNRILAVFAKSEADPRGTIRGRRHTMNNDDDVSDTRYSRCVLASVLASTLDDSAIYVSTRAEHHGPLGGGTLSMIVRRG
jgi:cyanuric acid amidohydrolase